ncbi:hypothetical protein SLE2022_360930 [Rubroshorea leprosula]
MEASAKLIKPSYLVVPRIASPSLTFTTATHSVTFSRGQRNGVVFRPRSSLFRVRSSLSPISPNSKPFGSLSVSSSVPFNSQVYFNSFPRSNPNEAGFVWNRAPESVVDGGSRVDLVGDKGPVVTVVLLGWLGSKRKYLKRYVEWYNSRGIHAVTFVVQVTDMLSFDLGTRLEQRISAFGSELGSWVLEKEEDGRERCLILHPFSNAGWLTCGAILDSFQGRDDIKEKIRGIIIDSGGGAVLNPKVWAAGLATAVLKKRNSSINGIESEATALKLQENEPSKFEAMLLAALEKLCSFFMPEIERRLRKYVDAFLEHPPPCPQLYLYSTADKVVPSETIELCMEKQRMNGIKVFSYDFGTSPHVDHYRTFPNIYSSQLHNFLKECFAIVKQK